MTDEIIELTPEGGPLSLKEIKGQVNLIQEIMAGVMKKDEHYGTIPGTQKPTLYKPGAEKLMMTFRFRDEYEVEKTLLGDNHREYEITCRLYTAGGVLLGEGLGECSTMETRYRWRKGETSTDKPVPGDYWKHRDIKLLGGKGHFPKKIDDKWVIFKQGDRVENPDIADVWNTVKKMAKKRALVDAILTRTAASDIFTQDLEDMTPEEPAAPTPEAPPKVPRKRVAKKKATLPPKEPPKASQEATAPSNEASVTLDKEGEVMKTPEMTNWKDVIMTAGSKKGNRMGDAGDDFLQKLWDYRENIRDNHPEMYAALHAWNAETVAANGDDDEIPF